MLGCELILAYPSFKILIFLDLKCLSTDLTSPNRAGVAEHRLQIWDKIWDNKFGTKSGTKNVDRRTNRQTDRQNQI